jgi:putative transposase
MPKSSALKNIKLPLDPDPTAKETVDGQSRICNWVYNRFLEIALGLLQEYIQTQDPKSAQILYSPRGLRNLLPELKVLHPFVKTVHSSPLKNTALRLSEAIRARQKSKRGKRKGAVVGWPRYHSWKNNWFSLLYDEPGKGFKVEGDILVLSLGTGEDRKRRSVSIPIVGAKALEGKEIRTLRIIEELGRLYAVFTVRVQVPSAKPISKVLALDPNHKNFAYGVDTDGKGIEIESPTWLRQYDRRIDELQAKRDRCVRKSREIPVLDQDGGPTGKSYWKASKNWERRDRTLKRALQKRRDQTKTFLFTVAHSVCKKYDCIGIGDYAPHGNGITTKMRRAMNNRSLIGRFKPILSWVALKSGKTVLIYDEAGTTRTCHPCKHVEEGGIHPSIRHWRCPVCSSWNHRDENSSKNGLQRVFEDLKKDGINVPSVSGSDLFHVHERWAWRVLPSGVVKHPRGQNSELIAAPGN